MKAIWTGAALALLLAAGAASAQSVTRDCGSWETSARNIAEPWEENTRTFANGAIRVAVLDTVEPAAAAFHLFILSPPYDELGTRSCAVVSEAEGMGFAGLDLSDVEASYDPSRGLTLVMSSTRWVPSNDTYRDGTLAVTINQASGQIRAVAR